MGQIQVVNGVVSASGYPNNKAAVDSVTQSGDTSAAGLAAADKAGNTVAPPVVTSPSTIGGVAVPQQTGVSNPPVATATLSSNPVPTASPDFSGAGTDPTSAFNIGATSKTEQKVANDGSQDATVASVFPTIGFLAPPSKKELEAVLADFYRDGKPADPDSGDVFAIQPKSIDPIEDTRASIRVFGFDPKSGKKGQDVELVPAFTKFILSGVQEQHMERSQIVETFGDFYVFFFGERPPMYQFSGTLINTRNVNWVSDFKFYYQNFLRGTKCVELGARLFLTYGGRQIEGFMLGMNTVTEASTDVGVGVSFPVVVTRVTYLGFSDDFGFVTKDGSSVAKDETFQALLDSVAGKEGKGTSGGGASQAANVLADAMKGGPAQKLMIGA